MSNAKITMTRHPVNSSNIRSIGFDVDSRLLEVEFHGRGAKKGPIWRYFPITLETYQTLVKSESIGNYFNTHIRGNTMLTAEKVSNG
jgi:hypothetical protein